MAKALTIGQVAQTTGVPARTIRYYEQVGVLPRAGRSAGGYRQYGDEGIHRLRFVRRARALGLSLAHLKTLTAALDGGACGVVRPRLRGLVQTHLSAVQQQIAELQLLQSQLEDVLKRLRSPIRRGRAGACRCLDTTETPASS